MKTTFYTFIAAFLFPLIIGKIQAQGDYSFGAQSSQTVELCQGGATTLFLVLNDGGTDGFDTDWVWNIPAGLTVSSGATSGTIANGTMNTVLSVALTTNGSSVTGNSYIVNVTASQSGGMATPLTSPSWNITINDTPDPTTINTPDGTETCDGNNIELQAVVPSGVDADYIWSTGETSANIVVNTTGTYDVSTSTTCGTSSASVMVTEEVTPSFTMHSCTNANNQLTFEVSASDNDNAGITLTFHEDDPANPALTNGGDYSLAIGPTLATLIVSNVNPNHQGVNFYAKATNSCGETISLACLALPIELEYFTGRYTGQAVVLDWATATETDNDYFSIERSTDGLNFKEIERIEGAGTSYFTLKYSYTDEEAPLYKQAGTLYYRLKQTDYNGSFSYSDVLAVRLGDAQEFVIDRVALSASQELQFSLQSARAAEAQISLYRMDGSRLFTQPIALQKGVQSYTVALPADLSAGLYLLRVESGAQTAVKKFIVSR